MRGNKLKRVTKNQRKRASDMLSRLKPFDEWVVGLDPEEIKAAERVFGNLTVFYEKFHSDLKPLAGERAEEQDISC
jgi:hypothetical protein